MIEQLNGDFLQWLRGFYYVATTGSVRQAALRMNRNPSTISYQLRCLEQELNTVLFDRYKKSLVITPEGEKLLEWTVSTFENLRGMRSDVATVQGVLKGTVTLSSNLPFAAQVVKSIASFREKNPLVKIKIKRALTAEVVSDVEGSRVDFGLTGVTRLPEFSDLEELFQASPLLIALKNNTFRLPKRPGPEDLRPLPFVSFLSEQMDESGDPYFGLNLAAGSYTQNSVLSVNNYHLMLRYVLHGVGVAIMDEMCLRSSMYGDDWSDLISYPLDDFLPTVKYGLLVRKRKHLSPQARALMECVRNEYSAPSL